MSDWTAGYVAEIDYTHGYYRELSPPILSLAVLNRAVATRRVINGTHPFFGPAK